ncbi:related to HDA1-histone deacetylase A [Sporisorium reilianum SRZ2]|uniref:histone deacetylase n=1 Tax=Sporisorium reilianum (strain SRZ2) TaxID=999809 RepID=E6ZZG4_SPORE|nr:related to HDA1-histone deacetylase A [Sporisorium reilianum SRZ2]
MSGPSRSPAIPRRDEPIEIDDDDEAIAAIPSTNHAAAASSSTSLRDVTPAMSVETGSSSSHDPINGFVNGNADPQSELDRYRTGYVYSSEMMLHVNPIDRDHPERPLRIWKIYLKFKHRDLFQRMKRINIREVAEDEVLLVHDKGIWDGVKRSALVHPDLLKEQVLMLESTSSLYVNEHSAYAARLSCGGAIELCDAVAAGRIKNGFAIVRPPGHHAEPHKSMGFCFFNNVAVATRHVMRQHDHIKKVLILDWDVHHGNGTQRAFEDDGDVLYISLHRYDEDGSFYPGSTYGHYESVGVGAGEGKSVNVPWPAPGMGDADYLYAFHHLVMPIAHEFQPDLVIVSAGFDAADGDPIGLNKVSPGGFAQMTHLLTSLCQGKVAVVLEGGYNPDAVANSALAVTEVLLSLNTAAPRETAACSIAANTVHEVRRHHAKHWKCLRASDLEADDVDRAAPNPPPSVDAIELLATYRNTVVAEEYDLMEVPLYDSPHSDFGGHALCSEGILDQFSTIIFFVHDMGNWRSERPRSSSAYDQLAIQLIDASKCVMEYARSRGYGLVDVNIVRQFSTTNPILPEGARDLVQHGDVAGMEQALKAVAFLWDNIISIADSSRQPCNVVLMGLGTGCNVLTQFIDKREAKSRVKAVVNVVGYGKMPSISVAADLETKKWYYKHSKVLAPADHRHLIERGDAAPLKRYGRIEPIHNMAPINMLSANMAKIEAFVEKKLGAAKRSLAASTVA